MKLEFPDNIHLQAPLGWMALGDHLEADKELDNITPRLRAHPDVLEVRWEIYAKEDKWEACLSIASAIIKLDDFRPFGWIHRSFALHELNRTQEACDQLLPVSDRFLDVWVIPYNLACYCSVLGNFEEAQDWFKKAMQIDEDTVKLLGIEDPDLMPLWDSMSGTMWKRE